MVWAAEATLEREVADCTGMKKGKWLFVSGCECKIPIFTASEFLNSCQEGTNVSVCWGIVLKMKMQ